MEFAGQALPLTDDDIAAAAAKLGLEPALIAAVAEVESDGAGFLRDKRPKILFERHVFSRETARRFDDDHSDISNPQRGGYGAPGAHQYDRLHRAILLNRTAALRSASWGRFQVMGFNHEIVGFRDVEIYVAAQTESEAAHLAAMIAFCQHNDLIRYLATHDWRSFTRGYNGSGRVDRYSALLEDAYREQAPIWAAKLAGGGAGRSARDDVRRIQEILGVAADGVVGKRTKAAFNNLAARAAAERT